MTRIPKYSFGGFHTLLLCLLAALTVWSLIGAHDPVVWWLEAAPCFAGLAVLALTFRRFQFTNLTYGFILLHMAILFVGAHYTYGRVPHFDTIDWLTIPGRNNYDKLGHFAQGFVPAMVVRELFLRLGVVARRSWLPFLVICNCIAISALYELIEWWIAASAESVVDDFLGMQEYVWDTQSDMFCALLGAAAMLLLCSRWQDRQIGKRSAG